MQVVFEQPRKAATFTVELHRNPSSSFGVDVSAAGKVCLVNSASWRPKEGHVVLTKVGADRGIRSAVEAGRFYIPNGRGLIHQQFRSCDMHFLP